MYRIPAHLGAIGIPASISPIGISLPPMAGLGCSCYKPGCSRCAYGIDQNPTQTDASANLVAAGGIGVLGFGLAALIIGGMSYLIYQEVQLKKQIVEKGGGEALMKYELGRAAGTVASGLFQPKDYRRNRKGKRKGKKKFGR